MKKIIQAIKKQNGQDILEWGIQLTDDERYKAIGCLMKFNIESLIDMPRPSSYIAAYYDERKLISEARCFAIVVCLRTWDDLKLTTNPDGWDKDWSELHTFFRQPGIYAKEYMQYLELFPVDYLGKIVAKIADSVHFTLLWSLYKHGYIAFDEELFVRAMFVINMFTRHVEDEIVFLSENKEVREKVMLQFYKYEIPILDISKWSVEGKGVCAKCYEYWDRVFDELLKKGLLSENRSGLIHNLLSTLTLNWKKGHLDWHVRLLKMLQPSADEWLNGQDVLLSALLSPYSSVVNFVVKTAETLYKEERFDSRVYLQNIPSLFAREKCDGAILTALSIVEYLLDKQDDKQSYAAIIADALMQPDEKIQQRAATLILKYFNEEQIPPLIEAYVINLKPAIRKLLKTSEAVAEEQIIGTLSHEPLQISDNWEDFLFHVGKTISSRQVADIELLYEALIQLQDQLPVDYEKQLKPFTKKLFKGQGDIYLSLLFDEWLNQPEQSSDSVKYYRKEKWDKKSLFCAKKNKWVLSRLKRQCKIPLLSTPTHAPFYVHPETLVDRLLQYEIAKEKVEHEDLIIACNRILRCETTTAIKQKAQQLKGDYAPAVHYLLGISDNLLPTEGLLPLWTQVARTRYPEKTFNEFGKTSASDFPSVVAPFYLSYEVERTFSDCRKYHWDRLFLQHNWNGNWSGEKNIEPDFPALFYYTAYNKTEIYQSMREFEYRISLIPHYVDALLLRFIPDTTSGNEVAEFEYCLNPLQFLYENQLIVHHSGWVYVAFCLLFEKKVSRQLAAEYINLAMQQGFLKNDYLAQCIGYMIAKKFAPVNRLMEYFDAAVSPKAKDFQCLIARKCVENADESDLPVNYKKVLLFLKQFG